MFSLVLKSRINANKTATYDYIDNLNAIMLLKVNIDALVGVFYVPH
jgi:hypothetical protein